MRQQRHQQHRDSILFPLLPPPSLPSAPPIRTENLAAQQRSLQAQVQTQWIKPSRSKRSQAVRDNPSHQTSGLTLFSRSTISMTFPSADILGSPGRNDHIKNAASPLTYSPPSTTTTTVPALPSRRSQSLNKSPRPRKISMASVGGGGEGITPVKRSDVQTEFYIPVELYLSSRASVGPTKVCSTLPPIPHPPSRQ